MPLLRNTPSLHLLDRILHVAAIIGISVSLCSSASSDTLKMRDDSITASFEQYFSAPAGADSFSAKAAFQNAWAYVGLPGLSLLHKNVFSAIELDFIDRAISLGHKPLNRQGTV